MLRLGWQPLTAYVDNSLSRVSGTIAEHVFPFMTVTCEILDCVDIITISSLLGVSVMQKMPPVLIQYVHMSALPCLVAGVSTHGFAIMYVYSDALVQRVSLTYIHKQSPCAPTRTPMVENVQFAMGRA
jgi:hypothetical protein